MSVVDGQVLSGVLLFFSLLSSGFLYSLIDTRIMLSYSEQSIRDLNRQCSTLRADVSWRMLGKSLAEIREIVRGISEESSMTLKIDDAGTAWLEDVRLNFEGGRLTDVLSCNA
ncbi:hypothetical protein D9M69_720170 [compost metagenome]